MRAANDFDAKRWVLALACVCELRDSLRSGVASNAGVALASATGAPRAAPAPAAGTAAGAVTAGRRPSGAPGGAIAAHAATALVAAEKQRAARMSMIPSTAGSPRVLPADALPASGSKLGDIPDTEAAVTAPARGANTAAASCLSVDDMAVPSVHGVGGARKPRRRSSFTGVLRHDDAAAGEAAAAAAAAGTPVGAPGGSEQRKPLAPGGDRDPRKISLGGASLGALRFAAKLRVQARAARDMVSSLQLESTRRDMMRVRRASRGVRLEFGTRH